MGATFLVVPQWQGSSSSRAMRLVDGANAIHGDLPSSATRLVEVPLEAGDHQGSGVDRCSSIELVRDAMRVELARAAGPVVTIGGDCGVELAAIEHVIGDDVAVVWLDAHPDLHTPESSASGAFHGMVLRTLMGDGAAQLVPARPLGPSHLVLAGTRALDDAEDELVSERGIRLIGVSDLSADSLVAAVRATGASSVYVHIDLDVIDPGDFAGLGFPEPFGVRGDDLVAIVKALKAEFALAGAGITEFAPASTSEAIEDLPTVLRLIGALAS